MVDFYYTSLEMVIGIGGKMMDLQQAIKYVMDEEAVLFLGAGFSYGGTNVSGGEMKVGRDLSYAICDDLGITKSDNLTISSSRYIEDESCKKGLEKFIDFLHNELICVETTLDQDTICKLPWMRIYTTNYDNIVEVSSEKQGISRETITITNAMYSAARNMEQAIVHINGFIKKLDKQTFYDEFKITDDNYNRDGLLQSPWRNLFETDLMKAKTVIFIGYSLKYDQELVRCIANLNIKEKCVFIDCESLSGDDEFKIKRYGTLYKIGTAGFVQEIVEVAKDYTPQIKKIELSGFEKRELASYYSDEHYSSKDVIDLLVKGKLDIQYITQAGYCVHRKSKMKEVKEQIKKKQVVIIQSKLGNGKTVFLECLAYELLKDYNVYFLKNIDNYIDDLQLIQSVENQCNIIMIDDYGYYIQFIKALGRNFPENLKLVITCRTAININLYYDLTEKYGYSEENLYLCDIDKMADPDIVELVKVLNQNRLWGKFDTVNFSQKKKLINRKYDANMSKIFYLLLESEEIEKQIKKVLSVLDEKFELRKFVIVQAINSLCRLKLSYSDICKFVNISDDLLRSYAMNQDVREILDSENNQFILSSAIYVQYLVAKSNMKKEMIEMLTKLYEECSKNDVWVKKYIQQRKFLVSRSNIKLIFSPKGKLTKQDEEEIFNYYDSIKNLTTATDNPFFWLQFGITALNLERYPLTKIYFDNAYANADKIDDFDSYQIDTHYARLLMCAEMSNNRNNKETALESFYRAHKLLWENSNSGTKLSYVLKQTGLYVDYYETYKKMLNEDERERYLATAYKMEEKYMKYFEIKDLFKVPIDVAVTYLKYRKIFKGTPYQIMLKKCDEIYNKKIPKSEFKAR